MTLESGLYISKLSTHVQNAHGSIWTAASYLFGCSSVHLMLSPQARTEATKLLESLSIEVGEDHLSVKSLCDRITPSDSSKIKSFLKSAIKTVNYSNCPAFFRLLLDYNLCREIFCLQIAHFLQDGGRPFNMKFFDNIDLNAVAIASETELIIIGPSFSGNIDRITVGAISNHLDDELELLVSRCERYCTRVTDGHIDPLYSPQYLKRSFFLRPAETKGNFLQKSELISDFIFAMKDLALNLDGLPIHHVFRISAAIGAAFSCGRALNRSVSFSVPVKYYQSGSVVVQTIGGCSDGKAIELSVSKGEELRTSFTQISTSDREVAFLFHMILRGFFSSYSNYFFESLVIFRNWLNNSYRLLEYSEGEGQQKRRVSPNMVRRMCRFLARLTNAEECTIYQGNYKESGLPLAHFGTFIDRKKHHKRQRLMASHMKRIALRAEDRNLSVSYRAFDTNESQSIRDVYEGTGTSVQGSRPNSIAIPVSENEADEQIEDWGRSLFSMPIRVNGVPWGALEIVSDSPHNFSNLVQSRVAEISTILSPFLFNQSINDGLHEILRLSSLPRMAPEVKREAICREFQQMFMCTGCVVVRRSYLSRRGPSYSVIGISGFEDGVGRNFESDIITDMSSVQNLFSERSAFSVRVGDPTFRRNFTAFKREFARAHQGEHVLGYRVGNPTPLASGGRFGSPNHEGDEFFLFFLYAKSILTEEKWHEVVSFLSETLFVILTSLTSNEDWERRLRMQLAHELRRISRALKQTGEKIEGSLADLTKGRKSETAEKAKYDADALTTYSTDLRRHSNSVEEFADILADARNRTVYAQHPMLYVAQHRVSNEQRTRIRLRDIYTEVFMGQSDAFIKRGILVDQFPKNRVPNIFAHEWILRDVLQSICENTLKYAEPKQELVVQVLEDDSALRLVISNLGPALTRRDLNRRYKEGHRGEHVKRLFPDEGKGLGLFYASQLMSIGGMNFSYTHKPLGTKGNRKGNTYPLGRHRFSLVFPRRIVLPE